MTGEDRGIEEAPPSYNEGGGEGFEESSSSIVISWVLDLNWIDIVKSMEFG